MPEAQIAIDATAKLLEEKIKARTRARGSRWIGLCRPAAGRRVRQSRVHGHRHRCQRREGRGASTPAIPTWAIFRAPRSAPLVESGKLRATTDFAAVLELDTINIAVPTPLRKTKDPDMSFIVSSCQEIARYFHAGHAHHSGIHHLSGNHG